MADEIELICAQEDPPTEAQLYMRRIEDRLNGRRRNYLERYLDANKQSWRPRYTATGVAI